MGDDDLQHLKEIEDLYSNINEKNKELEYVENIYQALIVQERKANDELQEARKELIEMYDETEAEDKAIELCAQWEEELRWCHFLWDPFKLFFINGKLEEIVDEDDERLISLKRDLGETVYKAVIIALTEIQDYNLSGGRVATDLWNFAEGKKATLGSFKDVGYPKAQEDYLTCLVRTMFLLRCVKLEVLFS